MATIPTQNAVPSEAPRDLKFNSGKIDEFVTSLEHEYKDRFGRSHMTIEGMRWIFDQLMERFKVDINQAIIAAGYIPMDSFQQGAEITKRNEILRDETTGEYYRWDGDLPKSVTAGSTPESAGGVGMGSWVSVGDAALRTMLASTTGTGLIGMPAGGALADTIHTVSVEQWSHLVGVDNDWSLAIQAAIDYMSENGGGVVEFGRGIYRADGIILKSLTVLKGQGMRLTMIKARDNWSGRSVVETENFDNYLTNPTGPGTYVCGCIGLTIHGNLQSYSGEPSVDAGYGLLHFGCEQVYQDFGVIYAPGIGLRTEGNVTSRTQFDSVLPDWAVPFIGKFDGIRIAKCGNDCWHYGGTPDQFIDDVEIMGAGYGSVSTDDIRSFMDSNERVACMRIWSTIELGRIHLYGNYNGYGLVAGPNTIIFSIRLKYDHIIAESCLIGVHFKKKAYIQGGILDVHECSGHLPVFSTFLKTPVLIIEGEAKPSTFSSIQVTQENNEYNGVCVYFGGTRNTAVIDVYRGIVSESKAGTGIWVAGDDNKIIGGTASGFAGGNDSEGNPSTGLVLASGARNNIKYTVGYSSYGFRMLVANTISSGELSTIGGTVGSPFSGFSLLTNTERKRVSLMQGNGHGNRGIFYSSALDLSNTNVNQISVTSLSLPYIPAPGELTLYLDIQATGGSSIYPDLRFIRYIDSSSTPNSLVFSYQANTVTTMSVRLAIMIG